MGKNVSLIPAFRGIPPVYGKDEQKEHDQRRQGKPDRDRERKPPEKPQIGEHTVSRYA